MLIPMEVHGLGLSRFVIRIRNYKILSIKKFVFWLAMIEILLSGMMYGCEVLILQSSSLDTLVFIKTRSLM
jgi:hypothetical protein